jgi:hypothetical protein
MTALPPLPPARRKTTSPRDPGRRNDVLRRGVLDALRRSGRYSVVANARIRGPEGEDLVLRDNFFVEKMLFEYGVMRILRDEEKAVYAAPFVTPESRLPTLSFPMTFPSTGSRPTCARRSSAIAPG